MATPIQRKVQQLQNAHFDLGAQMTAELDCGYGGKLQQFANANIYYHAVMGNDAHEVHGGIRTKYLALGGHDVNHASSQRLLGFPLSDEKNSDDAMCRVSRFEWGSIYWSYGGTVVYGKIHEAYLSSGGEKGPLGYPIADPVAVPSGLAAFFERGCMYIGQKSHNQVIQINYTFPQLGHPWMITSNDVSSSSVIRFSFYRSLMNSNIAGHLYEELFNGRIFIKETAGAGEIPLTFNFENCKQTSGVGAFDVFSSVVTLSDKSKVRNRQLYDVILKFPARTHSIAPHAIYFRDAWHDFKFIHATDLHISRRADRFRKFFSDRSMTDAVNNFNNFNDNFRQFIHYANQLHSQGNLDFVMITGDLVDYVFEEGGKWYHNDNFVYFENIVRGLTGKPDQVQDQELRVPIFTNLGNHDYRTRPYYPLFTVDIQWPASNRTMEQFGSYNITHDEAKVLTEDLLGIKSMVSSDTSIDMITPDRDNHGGSLNHYFRNICRERSYTVQLGDHKVIMIDGKWDDGTIEGTWDAISYYLGFKGESTDNFVDGSPDSVGFNGSEFDMISRALQNNGLVIIGMHDPVINPKQSEYAWFMRESIRASNPKPYTQEMQKYLFRRDPIAFITFHDNYNVAVDLNKNVHEGWKRTHTAHFHEGNGDDLLDYGIMRGHREDFLKMCAGIKNSPRPADLILSGHVHKNFESRIMWDAPAQNFRISHEFYTENPPVYYHSYDNNLDPDGKFTLPTLGPAFATTVKDKAKSSLIRVHVSITDAAAVDEVPTQGSSGVWSIKTKPYPLTLNAQPDTAHCQWWWQNVRPLFIQTAALGPSEFLRAPEHQPDFRGCRLITVIADTIQKIQYLNHDALKAGVPGDHRWDFRHEVVDRAVVIS
jgi:hypothetical protein